jgi:hypothetical protein
MRLRNPGKARRRLSRRTVSVPIGAQHKPGGTTGEKRRLPSRPDRPSTPGPSAGRAGPSTASLRSRLFNAERPNQMHTHGLGRLGVPIKRILSENARPAQGVVRIDAGRSSDFRAGVSSLLIGRICHNPTNNGIRGVTPVNARLPRRGRSGFAPDSLFAGLGRLPSPATSIFVTGWILAGGLR